MNLQHLTFNFSHALLCEYDEQSVNFAFLTQNDKKKLMSYYSKWSVNILWLMWFLSLYRSRTVVVPITQNSKLIVVP